MRTAAYPELEDALLTWHRMVRDQNIPVSGPMLQHKAEDLDKKLGVPDFTCINGWLSRLKERHTITSKKICGEAQSSPKADIEQWRNTNLPTILEQYHPDGSNKQVFDCLAELEAHTDSIKSTMQTSIMDFLIMN